MVQSLDAIRGGGGSVKVGTTGKIGALMSREIESTKAASKVLSFNTSINVLGSDIGRKKLNSRTSVDEASSSATSIIKSGKAPDSVRNLKHHVVRRTHHIPMLSADNMSLDGTPIRQRPTRRGPGLVEIVDIKCGNLEKTWRNPITNRLKKLSFTKLSESLS